MNINLNLSNMIKLIHKIIWTLSNSVNINRREISILYNRIAIFILYNYKKFMANKIWSNFIKIQIISLNYSYLIYYKNVFMILLIGFFIIKRIDESILFSTVYLSANDEIDLSEFHRDERTLPANNANISFPKGKDDPIQTPTPKDGTTWELVVPKEFSKREFRWCRESNVDYNLPNRRQRF
jgi:hypothetical protein